MAIQIILNQHAGPLPVKQTFSTVSDGPACLVVSGSVWCGSANTMIGVEVLIDGQNVGKAMIYSNLASTHRAVVPTYIPVKLTFGTHTLELTAATGNTSSDGNDLYSVVLDY